MDSTRSADTRTNEELLDAARNGDEGALGVLVERHRDRLERMVRLRMDRRLQGRVDPADVVQGASLPENAYLNVLLPLISEGRICHSTSPVQLPGSSP